MKSIDLKDEFVIKSVAELRELFGETHERIWAKASDHITPPMHKFIKLSPFCGVSSSDENGHTDISPRGDAPGFIMVYNDQTLVIPDRPGNRRYDTFRNVLATGAMSVMFMIPGVPLTVRVNGKARITHDPELLAPFEVQGKLPAMAFVLTVEEAYGHCAKAILRSKLWSDDHKLTSADVPDLAELMSYHLRMDKSEYEEMEDIIRKDLIDSMY